MSPDVRLDPGTSRPRPHVLVGGSPLRVLHLSPAGARVLDALLAGRDVPGVDLLRERLLEAGLLLAEPGPPRTSDVTVVVPVRGTAAQVRPVLAGVPPGVRVVVVDDGSTPPLDLPGVEVLRREVSGGPAAARNAGAALARTPLVAFVDADVTLPPGWLDRLSGHLHDPRVVAVAPRIVSGRAAGAAGVLEQALGALDQGADPGVVRPSSRLAYVPSTVLLVRRQSFADAGGFDEDLHVGEDVDLVWRLAAHGVVRYDPEVVAVHAPRRSLQEALARRRDYGTSCGPLDVRHPGRLRHLVVSRWTALPWLAGLVHPALLAVAVGALVARAPRVLPSVPAEVARGLVLEGQRSAVEAAGRYALRPALPLTVGLALASARVRRLLPLVVAAYALAVRDDVTGGPQRLALRLADDVAYSAGVWVGCVGHRRWRPLLPGAGGQRAPLTDRRAGAGSGAG